ncbi:DNA gyrase inhibitor YacG [uncultured Cohaesibacter sp.]|uniref:DNA gyrase inhibitor YacG n=1 Tax=uncultured Cohaesibacter sp. TaxID=1002546 RepID=UPI002931CFE8|nr:DNA gyrase inhibitor YacG [uncultured Cohaesibacter sp.]
MSDKNKPDALDEPNESNEPKGATVKGLRRSRSCPICGKASSKESYPFCSERCKQVDLSRWLSGSYAIPASEEDDPDEDDLNLLEKD